MMNDNELGNIFGKAEETMGVDAYQAQVENTKADTQIRLAHAELERARAKMFVSVPGAVFIGIVVAAPPVAVWLWRWAVS